MGGLGSTEDEEEDENEGNDGAPGVRHALEDASRADHRPGKMLPGAEARVAFAQTRQGFVL